MPHGSHHFSCFSSDVDHECFVSILCKEALILLIWRRCRSQCCEIQKKWLYECWFFAKTFLKFHLFESPVLGCHDINILLWFLFSKSDLKWKVCHGCWLVLLLAKLAVKFACLCIRNIQTKTHWFYLRSSYMFPPTALWFICMHTKRWTRKWTEVSETYIFDVRSRERHEMKHNSSTSILCI